MNIDKFMQQFLVYYERTNPGGSGEAQYKPPVEVKCRWDDIVEEVVASGGRRVMSKSFLITPFRFKEGSLVWLAPTLVEGQALVELRKQPWYPKPPNTIQGGYECVVTGHNPDPRGQPLLYTCRL